MDLTSTEINMITCNHNAYQMVRNVVPHLGRKVSDYDR